MTTGTGTGTARALRESLDRDGCGHGQLTRERLTNVDEDLKKIDEKVNTIMMVAIGQLSALAVGVLFFVLNHVRV